MKWAFVLMMVSWPLSGQVLSVYSEFAQIDAQGNVTAPETPREILSPALVRNGFTSFQVVVQVPPGMPYVLRIGQNPEKAAEVTLYRSEATTLRRVVEPVASDATQTFWMDVWIDKDAPVRRIKVEPELQVNGDWATYPMEMRVRENVIPDFTPAVIGAASSPFELLRSYMCSVRQAENAKRPAPTSSPTVTPEVVTVAALHMRNARQDVAMASQLFTTGRDELRKWMGGCNARPSDDPEFYLHVRDYFWTPLWMKISHGN